MIIPTHFGQAGPLWRAQLWHGQMLRAWAFGRLVPLDFMAVDLRFALASVVTRSLNHAADALVRHLMGRAWRGARFAEDITAAATMVAAAGR
ncbi:hypothetical protein GPL17_10195 [Bradyrhizobium yuanmingense]|uniref:hypothetical protein n=1 Tax=Bradyrhizobium TaxID=374 RepID=UPI0012FA1BD6|nr:MULTISPECIES: hypothetical protein [Bradyrhizobium]MDA9549074.1 hypothetical protein [Bradyrhizobium sp. CCBAU 45321]MDF0493511.1 hypothetical protein [Bradyrhizobium yuanmingense]MDF0582758.1 hypothetical protein [Bradyrhizobium yuanmingense]MVT50862.1 hypothetical protein [Bradyrhizobium yuanmingense]